MTNLIGVDSKSLSVDKAIHHDPPSHHYTVPPQYVACCRGGKAFADGVNRFA